jgi:hypothetical protein
VSDHTEGGHGPEPVGSVGEEAAKLFGALSGWASEHARDVDEHLATGTTECRWCPVCRTVHALRTANPEVRAQLTTAAQSFLQAASTLLAAAVPPQPGGSGRPAGSPVQRIDLDGDLDLDDGPDDGPEHPSQEDEQ